MNTGCDGSTAEAHYRCGYDYQAQGDSEAAIREYSEAIRLKPDFIEALNNRAVTYRKIRQPDAAIRDFTAVIREQPQFAFPYNNRAGAYQDVGNRDAALKDLDTAVRLDPTFADAYYNRGVAHMDGNQLEEAVLDFTEAIRFYDEAAKGPSDRVRGWYDHGSDKWPSRTNPKIRIIDQKLADSYYMRSQAYGMLGEYSKAEPDLKEAWHTDPDVFRRRHMP